MYRERSNVEMPARSANVAKECPQIVDPSDRVDSKLALGRLPFAVAEVVQVEVAAPSGGEHERRVGSGRKLLECDARDRLERHGASARVGLRALEAAVAERSLDVEDAGLVVDVAMLERDPFARPQPGRGGEQHERPWGGPIWSASCLRSAHESNGRCSMRGRCGFSTPFLAGLVLSMPQLTARARVWRSAWVASKRCPRGIVIRHAAISAGRSSPNDRVDLARAT
jgi:hypothetical protein